MASARSKVVTGNVYNAIDIHINSISVACQLLKQPMNQSEQARKEYMGKIKEALRELALVVDTSITKGDLVTDPCGVLSGSIPVLEKDEFIKAYPHAVAIPVLLKSVLEEENLMARRTNRNKATISADQASVIDVVAKDMPAPSTPIVDKPLATVVEEASVKTQAVVNNVEASVTEKPLTAPSTTVVYNKASVESVLQELQDSVDDTETNTLLKKLKDYTRNWYTSTEASIRDLDNENRLTSDKDGVLAGVTIFSTEEMMDKYDYSHKVDQFLSPLVAKSKTSVHGAIPKEVVNTALTDLQDDSKPVVEIQTAPNESIIVDKVSNTTQVKQDGKIVKGLKWAYNGLKSIFNFLINKAKAVGNWVKSFFTKSEDKPVVVTEEEAAKMRKDALASAV